MSNARAPGVALTMTAGSASVARDSPPVFNNILAWKDEVVGWMKKLADECHDHGCAVMIQLTHLGRRTPLGQGRLAACRVTGPCARTLAQGLSEKGRKIGTLPALSPITPMPPNGCKRQGWTGSNCRLTGI